MRKSDLVVSCLILSVVLHQIVEGYFLTLVPGVREYRVGRDLVIADQVLCQGKLVAICVV